LIRDHCLLALFYLCSVYHGERKKWNEKAEMAALDWKKWCCVWSRAVFFFLNLLSQLFYQNNNKWQSDGRARERGNLWFDYVGAQRIALANWIKLKIIFPIAPSTFNFCNDNNNNSPAARTDIEIIIKIAFHCPLARPGKNHKNITRTENTKIIIRVRSLAKKQTTHWANK
jgi:hypothetical protein